MCGRCADQPRVLPRRPASSPTRTRPRYFRVCGPLPRGHPRPLGPVAKALRRRPRGSRGEPAPLQRTRSAAEQTRPETLGPLLGSFGLQRILKLCLPGIPVEALPLQADTIALQGFGRLLGFQSLGALSLYLLEALAALAFEVLPQRRLGPFGKLQATFQTPELAL